MQYIIEILDTESNEISYFAYDVTSGGYPWFPNYMFHAHPFKDLDQARKEYAELIFETGRVTKYSSGKTGAPTVIRQYANLCNAKQSGRFVIKLLGLSGSAWSNIKAEVLSSHIVTVQEFLHEHKEPIITSQRVI